MAWTRRSRLERDPEVLEELVDGQLVVLHPGTGEYAGLAGTAVRVWELLSEPATGEPMTLGLLVDVLAREYGVSRAECAPSVTQCLEVLRRQGLVVVVPD